MDANPFVAMLAHTKQYFDRSTACLDEADAGFSPKDGMYTVAQQVAHVAETVDWFVAGGFSPEGFDKDFEALDKRVRAVTSLTAARAWLERAFTEATEVFSNKTPDELMEPIKDDHILSGEPRTVIVPGITEHTAHHRGALTVYARMLGKTPAMPYE
ncbi:MAG: DinB family protein [Planctomycetota bacterium]|jgi:uncharacterized damage-inducible protein DinB